METNHINEPEDERNPPTAEGRSLLERRGPGATIIRRLHPFCSTSFYNELKLGKGDAFFPHGRFTQDSLHVFFENYWL